MNLNDEYEAELLKRATEARKRAGRKRRPVQKPLKKFGR